MGVWEGRGSECGRFKLKLVLKRGIEVRDGVKGRRRVKERGKGLLVEVEIREVEVGGSLIRGWC